MTRSIESGVDIPLFHKARYRVEKEPFAVDDAEKGRIPVERYIAPAVYTGDQPAFLIASGWGEGCTTLEKSARQLAQAGRAVYTFNHRRSRAASDDPEAYKASTLGSVYQEAATREAKITILAHSEGAISAIKLAKRLVEADQADALSGISVAAPAGYTGMVSSEELFMRGFFEMAQHTVDLGTIRSFGLRGLMSVTMYSAPHTGLGRRELYEVGHTDLTDDTRFLLEAGIPVGMVGCRRDILIPATKLRDKAANLAPAGLLYDEVNATHIQFLTKPVVVKGMLKQAAALEELAANNALKLQQYTV